MRKGTSWITIITIMIIVGIIISQCSCNTAKQNFKRVNEAILESPAQTAKQFSDKWPCIPIATVSDSTDYKQYKAELAALTERHRNIPREVISNTIMEIWADTAKIKALRKQVFALQEHEKQLNAYISDLTELSKGKPPIHDTIVKEDYARMAVYTGQIDQLSNENKRLSGNNEGLQTKLFWILIALATSVVGNIVQIKIKKWTLLSSTKV